MGFSFNVLSSMIVPLVVVLASPTTCTSSSTTRWSRATGSREDAFVGTVLRHPAAVRALATTALGMLSLATSHVQAVR